MKKIKKQASALIIVLSILFLISTIAVSFIQITNNGLNVASNNKRRLQVKLASQAGIHYAIAKLRRDFQKTVICTLDGFPRKVTEPEGERRWQYTALNDSGGTFSKEDDVAAGIPLEDLQKMPVVQDSTQNVFISPHPSYAELDQVTGLPKVTRGLVITKVFKASQSGNFSTFTLKIIDTSAQFDLNSQKVFIGENASDIPLAKVLENLSLAIATRKPYKDVFPGDTNGPFFDDDGNSLAAEIVSLREALPDKEFRTKYQLLAVNGISEQKMKYAWDYLTTTISEQKQTVVCRAKETLMAAHSEAYRPDRRAPININTAPWPILAAIFWDLTAVDPDDGTEIVISQNDAFRLADAICEERRQISTFDPVGQIPPDPSNPNPFPFGTWELFKNFLLNNTDLLVGGPAPYGDTSGTANAPLRNKKAMLVYAMADPNVTFRRLNPDRPMWQEINKTDITHYTTELCFYAQGYFEITSLGQIITPDEEVVLRSKNQSITKIFTTDRKGAQQFFHQDRILEEDPFTTGTPEVSEFADINSFSYPNNIQVSLPVFVDNNVHPHVGYVQPVISDFQYGDNRLDLADGDGPPGGITGKLLFKSTFNARREADLASGEVLPVTTNLPSSLLSKREDIPTMPVFNETTTNVEYGHIAPDGVLFFENEDSLRDTHDSDPTVITETSTLSYKTHENMPDANAIDSGVSLLDKDGGMLLFWLKLNRNRDWTNWRSIFFSTSPDNTDPERGIQMEIQAKYNENDGELQLQVRRWFYDTNPDFIGGELQSLNDRPHIRFIRAGIKGTFTGVRTHEWYHLAISWHKGTDMTLANPVIIHGNFYDPIEIDNPNAVPIETVKFGGVDIFQETDAITGEVIGTLPDLENPAFTGDPAVVLPEDITPIEPSEALPSLDARMFLGTVKRTGTEQGDPGRFAIHGTAMTIDDLRIVRAGVDLAGLLAMIDVSSTLTRLPPLAISQTINLPDGNSYDVVSLFVGEYTAIADSAVILGVFDWTIRTPSNSALQSSAQTTGFPIGGVSANTEPIVGFTTPISRLHTKHKPIFIKGGDRVEGVKRKVIEEMFEEVFEEPLKNALPEDIDKDEFIDNTDIVKVLVRVWENAVVTIPVSGVNKDLKKVKEDDIEDILEDKTALVSTLLAIVPHIVDILENGATASQILDLLGFLLPEEDIPPGGAVPPNGKKGDGKPKKGKDKKVVAFPQTPIGGGSSDLIIAPLFTNFQFKLEFLQQQNFVAFTGPAVDDIIITYQEPVESVFAVEISD